MAKFLIPVNFAPYTINAVDYCVALANHIGGEISLLFCYTHMLSDDQSSEDEPVILSEIDAMNALKQLESHIFEHNHSNKTIMVKKHLLEGYPEDIIPKFCKGYDPNLVVMGTKSKGETIKELLGSVTLDVIKNVSCPVMAVPNNYIFNLKAITNILFVTHFSKNEFTSLHKLLELISSFDTKLFAVQYCANGIEKEDPESLKQYLSYVQNTYRNQDVRCEFIENKEILEAINAYITLHNIDLLAITRRKRNLISQLLHPSVTKKILFNTEIPMLFFHQ